MLNMTLLAHTVHYLACFTLSVRTCPYFPYIIILRHIFHKRLNLLALYPYLQEVGLILLLHSLRSRAISIPTQGYLTHVLAGLLSPRLPRHPHHPTPGSAKVVTLRTTLFSRPCTCPNHRRRPLRMVSSIGGRFNSRIISSFRICSSLDTPRFPRSTLISVLAISLLLLVFIVQHPLPYLYYVMMTSYTFDFSFRDIFVSYNTPVNFLQLDHAACSPRSTSFDPRYLKWYTFLSASLFSCICSAVSLIVRYSVLPH